MKVSGIVAVVAGCLGLGACAPPLFDDPFEHYAQRTDKVTLSAGNALNANETIHTIDPWPRYAYDTRIPGDAARLTHVVTGYQGGSEDPKQGGSGGGNGGAAAAGPSSAATP